MKTLRRFLFLTALLLIVLGVCFLLFHESEHRERSTGLPSTHSTNTAIVKALPSADSPHAVNVPSKAERARMSRADRLALLERLGHVPDDADWDEFNIAEGTTWWGKRVDPIVFWSNRVVWLDEGAIYKAWRYGRSWPPIPFGDTTCSDRNDQDKKGNGFSIQGGPSFSSVSSGREGAFWVEFGKTHPTPPADLDRWQVSRAADWMRSKYILANDNERAARLRMSPTDPDDMLESRQREVSDSGYPPECVNTNAFYWAHVMQRRDEYAKLFANGAQPTSIDLDRFYRNTYVDRKLITEPLTPEQLDAANAWKVAYLRRLRAQKTDESYINAYMQAWGLDAKAVFKEP